MANQAMIVGGGGKGRSPSDFYPTPPEVTVALLEFLDLPKGALIWEPAAGAGDMAKVMRSHGYPVLESDIRDGTDFLHCYPLACDWIITNPPFSRSEEFIARCIELGKPFALLLKSQYWHAAKRLDIFRDTPPAYVLPLTWRPDFSFKADDGKPHRPPMDVMWCVWVNHTTYITRFQPLKKPDMGKDVKHGKKKNVLPGCGGV